jgi:hypothetical protein
MACVTGTLIRNSYIGFLVILAVNAACVAIPIQRASQLLYVLYLTPVWLWRKQPLWFTDGDGDIIWSRFETLGLAASLSLLAVICAVSAIYFRKRDIT